MAQGLIMPNSDQFIRRYLDPFHESFCRECARQVGMTKQESGLDQDEKNHVCDPRIVEQFRKRAINREDFLRKIHSISN